MDNMQMDYMATLMSDIEGNDKCVDFNGQDRTIVLLMLHVTYGEYTLDFDDEKIGNFINMN